MFPSLCRITQTTKNVKPQITMSHPQTFCHGFLGKHSRHKMPTSLRVSAGLRPVFYRFLSAFLSSEVYSFLWLWSKGEISLPGAFKLCFWCKRTDTGLVCLFHILAYRLMSACDKLLGFDSRGKWMNYPHAISYFGVLGAPCPSMSE